MFSMQLLQPGPGALDIAEVTKARLDELLADTARADTKAGQMLALFGVLTALTGLIISRYHAVPTAASILLVVSAGPMAAALLSLLLVVRPSYQGASFVRHASASENEVITDLNMTLIEYRVGRIMVLSEILLRKYRGVRRAVHLVLVASGLALAATLVAAV